MIYSDMNHAYLFADDEDGELDEEEEKDNEEEKEESGEEDEF